MEFSRSHPYVQLTAILIQHNYILRHGRPTAVVIIAVIP
jgi:hypothetical protein